MECAIIEDLLPLYAENICSPQSRAAVEAHLAECESCRRSLKELNSGDPAPALPDLAGEGALKKVKKAVFKNMLLWWAGLTLLLAAFIAVAAGVILHRNGLEEIVMSLLWFLIPFTAFGVSVFAGLSRKKYAFVLPLLLLIPIAVFGHWAEFAVPLGAALTAVGFSVGKWWFGKLLRRQKSDRLKKQLASICAVLAAGNIAFAVCCHMEPNRFFFGIGSILQLVLLLPLMFYLFSFLCCFRSSGQRQFLFAVGSILLASAVVIVYLELMNGSGTFDSYMLIYALLPGLFGAAAGAVARRRGEGSERAPV